MRLPLIAPADLTPEQKPLYDAMRKGIASNFNAFKVEREDGALMGPWNPWLHEPAIGKAILAQLPHQTLASTVGARPLARKTPRTIVAPEALQRELALVRARGYALDDEENEASARCLEKLPAS